MALSAAELQKRHGLEGAPDPFPVFGKLPVVSKNEPTPVDSSEEAFPSLGSSAAPANNISKPAISAWAAKPSTVKSSKAKPTVPGGLGRRSAPTATSHPCSESFSIPANEIETGKAFADVLKKVTEQTGSVVESSTQMRTGLRTFLVRASDQKRLAYAKKLIERGLSKTVTIEVEVPISTLGSIIGPKGATLKAITDATQCKIDIPRRDTLPTWEPKQNDDSDDEDSEPLVSISVSGPSVAATDARTRLLALILHKVSHSTATIKTIPSSVYPFISRIPMDNYDQVKVHVPPPAVWKALERQGDTDVTEKDISIKVKGEKDQVKAVVEVIQKQYEQLRDSLRELKISIPKRQHRFLVGSAATEILDQTNCIVELPPVEDPSDQRVIRGPQASLIPALTLVMDKANAIAVEMVDVAALHRNSPASHAKQVLRYLQRSGKLRSIAENHQVKVYPPFVNTTAVVEIVGADKVNVSTAREEVGQAVKSILPAGIRVVEVDHVIHGFLIGKQGANIAKFESTHGVVTVFPNASEESSEVLLVYTDSHRSPAVQEKLATAADGLSALAKEAADIKTETLNVDKKWHRFVIGPGGTVLNSLIGDAMIKVGPNNEDIVVVRGQSTEVDRIVDQINQIVSDAIHDDIVNGYTIDFPVDKKYVPHLVGSSGSSINKLREHLGVKVTFDDEGKKVTCKIVGRKEAVEEARRRLDAQIEKLQDETTEIITIKRSIQPALIGTGGKYAIRLEEKYGVHLSFPRDGKEGKPDEVTIRGGKKGVTQAKAELLEAAAFESESRQNATFEVPTKAVAQIVGKGGATINAIKDETGAQIDIDRSTGEKTTVTVKGDKKAIAAAKTAVLALVNELGDEINVSITIDPKYHRSLIGQGGQKLRDLISEAGGPAEGFKQAGLVTFPREGRDGASDEVKLRGDSKMVNKIKAELEKQVAMLKETSTVGVIVPAVQHASKIGRGGSALQDLQRKTGATIHFPGSRQYSSVGEIENEVDAPPADIVKVIGTKDAIAAATESLQSFVERAPKSDNTPTPQLAISVPNKYYHALAGQPNLIRQIRNAGGHLAIPQPAPAPSASVATSARIDSDASTEEQWEVIENYNDGPDGEMEWTIRGKEENLDRVVEAFTAMLDRVKAASHVGLLTGLPRSVFPRIIGSKGSTISRLRIETGADIQVGRDDDLIKIIGDMKSIQQAKEVILEIASR